MSKSLKNKATTGIGWSFIDNFANQGIVFFVGIVLARILSPKEYGIIGIIAIFIAVFNSIVDSGFSSALIRKRDADNKDYNTVFLFNLSLSLILYIIVYLIAPFISKYFNQPLIEPLLKVMGLIIIINAFAIIQRTILVKEIDFKTQTKVSVFASTISGVVGIAMALNKMGVWSLAGQQISRQLINSLLLWYFSRAWTPSLEFSFHRFKELFNFGWKILVDGLIGTIWNEIYQAVIGKVYTPEVLGQFTRANQFRNITSRNLSTIVQRVSYPTLCSIHSDIGLKEAFRKIIKVTTLFSFIMMIGIGATAKPLIISLIGEKWLPAATFLQIICFSGLWNPLQVLNKNIMQVKGFSGLMLKTEIASKAVAIIPILMGIFLNIYWMLWGSVFANVIIYFSYAFFGGKLIKYSLWEQLKDIFPSLILSFIIGAAIWPISFLEKNTLFILFLQISIGGVLTFGLCELLKREEYITIKSMAKIYIRKLLKYKHNEKNCD